MNARLCPTRLLAAAGMTVALALAGGSARAGINIAQTPLYLGGSAAPLNMLVLGRDHTLYYEAYNDASDLDGDGVLDVGYKPAQIDYAGYFDSYKCYDYNSTDGRFDPRAGQVDNKQCSGAWSGDFLNYLTTARIDALRMVLYGGKRVVDTDSLVVLERTYIPQDGHSWGKEYTSVLTDGYDIRNYAPLPLPYPGTRHLFANTTLLKADSKTAAPKDNAPLLRVLPNSIYRIWQWVAIERPVAGALCLYGNGGPSCASGEQRSCALTQGMELTQSVYDIDKTDKFTNYDNPKTTGEFDQLVEYNATAANRCGSGSASEVNLTQNPFLGQGKGCGNSKFLTIYDGTINIPEAGEYEFAVDGSDAVDFSVDGSVVTSWYGKHGACSSTSVYCQCDTHRGTVYLTAGVHYVRFRHQIWTGGQPAAYLRTRMVKPASIMTNYTVRVKVCDPTLGLEGNCRAYPAGTYKPAGLLQQHGEDERMLFGLISGAYTHPFNMRGGVLRKNMGSLRDEIDPQTGAFSSLTGIIGTIDRMRIIEFDKSTNYNYVGGWLTTASMVNKDGNKFPDWGNPIAEMMYEAVRYFAGKPAATPQFLPATGTTETVKVYDVAGSDATGTLTLPLPVWQDPFRDGVAATASCSAGAMLVISDVSPIFDSDQVPGSAFANFTGDLSGLNVQTAANDIWTAEHGAVSRQQFIGEVGSLADGAPTEKTVSGLGNIRGLVPAGPTKQGSYYSAGIARYAFETDLRPDIGGRQNVNTVLVALASALPRIEIPVSGTRVTIAPFAKSVGGSSIKVIKGAFQPTDTIVDFFIEAFANTAINGSDADSSVNEGRPLVRFRINFEDVEQGADHDMDAVAIYEARVNANGTLTMNMTSEYAGGGIIQHMGYVISGTTRDGAYLEVRDADTAEADDPTYFLDTPPGLLPGDCGSTRPPTACNDGLPLTATRSFLPGTGSGGATVLNSPLWYAAKYGTKRTGQLAEGETSSNYFLVTNAANLSKQLERAFDDILGLVSSSSSVALNSTSLNADTLAYQARFDSGEWQGEVRAVQIMPDGSQGETRWTTNTAGLIPLAGARSVITFNGEAGVEFLRAELPTLSLDQCAGLLGISRAALVLHLQTGACDPDAAPGSEGYCHCADVDPALDLTDAHNRLAWLRGDAAQELPTGAYRKRRVRLGDIINSAPFLVRNDTDYDFESLSVKGPESSYEAFRKYLRDNQRPPVLYVGANDGMLHAFHADTGHELFAFMPMGVFGDLADLTKPDYADAHRFYVDGSPWVVDAFISAGGKKAAWHTVLVGSLGAGGRSVFALDVTDPSHFSSDDVLWEFTDPELGVTMGRPTIARLASGWVALFANGYNSQSARAQLLVVDLATGALLRRLDTGVGSGGTPNGLATPLPVDVGTDRITDRVYAGDLLGNLWRFDLTDPDPAKWAVAFSGQPLFTAGITDAAGEVQVQPITSRPAATMHPYGGMMVLFGTGKFFSDGDETVRINGPVQSLYGIRDAERPVSGRKDLQAQRLLLQGTATDRSIHEEVRVVSNASVNYDNQSGWYLDLMYANQRAGERVIDQPVLQDERVLFSTLIPGDDACSAGGSGWQMLINTLTGGSLSYSGFDLNRDGRFDGGDQVMVFGTNQGTGPGAGEGVSLPVSGVRMGAIFRMPALLAAVGKDLAWTSDSQGALGSLILKQSGGSGRRSWRQLR